MAWFVCLSVGHIGEPSKMAEPVEMLFGGGAVLDRPEVPSVRRGYISVPPGKCD